MAWIGAVIQGAAALYGMYQQSKQSKQGQQLINSQLDAAQSLQKPGQQFLSEGQTLAQPATQRLLALAAGNRGEVNQYLAPEFGDINARADEQQRVASELMGRGGGRAQLLASQPYAKLDQMNRLYAGARDTANSNLLQLADSRMRLGTGMLGAALGGLQGATQGQLQLNKQNYEQQSETGASLADAWNQFYKWYSSRGTSGTGGG